MTIQPSVMVWTVICFLILMAILKNLLFTPVLKMIDSRREKIQAAAKKKVSKKNFFTFLCSFIWVIFSLAVGDCWYEPLLFTAPFFIPLLFVMAKFEKKLNA